MPSKRLNIGSLQLIRHNASLTCFIREGAESGLWVGEVASNVMTAG